VTPPQGREKTRAPLRAGRRSLRLLAAVLGSALLLATLTGGLLFVEGCDDKTDTSSTTTEAVTGVETFADMGPDHPDLKAARAVVVYGLLEADPEGRFRPEDPVERSEFASLLVAVFDLENPVPSVPTFADVPPAHPDYAAVERAAAYFLRDGGAEPETSMFRPHDPITRGEADQILRLVVQAAAPDLTSVLPAEAVSGADQPLSRAEAARLLVPLIEAQQPPAAETFEAVGIN